MHKEISEILFDEFRDFVILSRLRQIELLKKHKIGRTAMSQGRLLECLHSNNGIAQKELSEMLEIRPGSLSELVTKAENRKLIERRINPDDKRVTNIFLTGKGMREVQKFIVLYRDMTKDIFDSLTEKEQSTLCSKLKELNKSIDSKLDR
ncbi:MarR family winged helix-turn-helix transcriptional regulator [Metaclostridioides mangenotii]|uniref:MarR family winged helix-turn-helix transcriptional regulator n=1 Tax=Metaclostridioides mangenotii TaxID=1540 RepID=UPI000463DD8F|nr:MarR family transcriptional regulator [Clostridioides mangenotii]